VIYIVPTSGKNWGAVIAEWLGCDKASESSESRGYV